MTVPVPDNALAGWDIYRASDYEATLVEINDEFLLRGLPPVSLLEVALVAGMGTVGAGCLLGDRIGVQPLLDDLEAVVGVGHQFAEVTVDDDHRHALEPRSHLGGRLGRSLVDDS